MQLLVNSFITLVRMILYLLDTALFVRAIMSWIMPEDDSKFSRLLYQFTEPFLIPFRKLAMRIEFFRTLPIDMGFMLAVIALSIIQVILPTSVRL